MRDTTAVQGSGQGTEMQHIVIALHNKQALLSVIIVKTTAMGRTSITIKLLSRGTMIGTKMG